jgi:transcription elongation factor Elf1
MAEKELRFTCCNCQKETTVIVTVTTQRRQSKPVPVVRYCESCNRATKLPVPDNVDVHVFILGRDEGFLRSTAEGIAVLQGEKFP